MGRGSASLLVCMLWGCTVSTTITDEEDGTTDAVVDKDAVDDETGDPFEDTYVEPISDFEEAKLRVTEFVVNETGGADMTGDGMPDNALPGALFLLGSIGLSVQDINANVAWAFDNNLTIVLLHARQPYSKLFLDVLVGKEGAVLGTVEPDPGSYNPDGTPRSGLEGAFTDQDDFDAGPATIGVMVSVDEDIDPFMMQFEVARVDGTVDNTVGIQSTLTGAIPVDSLMADVVTPLIPEEGYNIDFDAELETKEEVLAFIEAIATQVADVELDGDRKGISAAFTLNGIVIDW